MSNTQNYKTGGSGIGFTLFIVFLILKLTNTIDWSWWWVTCPLWIGIALWLGIVALIFMIGLFIALLKG